MDKKNLVKVPLSKNTTTVLLPFEQGRALAILMAACRQWVKYPDLLDAGIRNPESTIEALMDYGVEIEMKIKDTVSKSCELFEDAPHYKYLGWCIDMSVQSIHECAKEKAK